MIEDSQHGREHAGESGMEHTPNGTIGGPLGDAPDAQTEETAGASAAPAPSPASHDTADSTDAPSAASGEPGEASPRAIPAPKACPCSLPLPCHLPLFRRGVCRTAYRKLSEAGLPIGDDGRTVSNTAKNLAQVARRLSSARPEWLGEIAQGMRPDARDRLAEALARASGKGGR